MLKYIKYYLKTKNYYLKTLTEHPYQFYLKKKKKKKKKVQF